MTVLSSLVRNPKGAVDLFGLTTYGGSNNNFKLEAKPTEGPGGISAFKFFFNEGQTGDAGAILDSFNLDAGTYTLQWKSQTNELVTNAHIYVRDASYQLYGIKHYGANRPWTSDSLTFSLSSRTTVQVMFGLGSYGSTSGGTCWFTLFGLTSGATAPPYFDGDTPDVAPSGSVAGNTYSWTGTPNKSTSTWDNNVTSGTIGGSGSTGGTTAPTAPTTTTVAGYTLVDFDDFTEGSSPSATRWTVYDNGGSTGGTVSTGWKLWADPGNTVGTLRGNYTDPVILAGIDYIVATPGAKWLGQPWVPLGSSITANAVAQATSVGALPVFILYDFPDRDAGGSSSGGAASNSEYLAWTTEQANAISNTYCVIAIEPDTLPLVLGQLRSGKISQATFDAKMQLLSDAVDILLAKCPNAKIYHDNGHSQWLGPDDMAYALAKAGVAKCHGINENISNFRPTADCETHANGTIDILENQYSVPKGRLGFIIDTSRNGAQNPPNPQDWQNPPGIALGERSRFDPNGLDGVKRRHGHIWCKVPGESDGPYNSGGDGIAPPAFLGTEPQAGTVWAAMVEHIIRNSALVQTAVGGQAVVQSGGLLNILGQGNYTGGLNAKGHSLKYGRWEVRTKLDRGPGYGAVVALKSASIADGEIGFFSTRDGGADKVRFYVRAPNGAESSTTVNVDVTVLHNYALEWTPTAITFYVDNGKAWEVTGSSNQPLNALALQIGLLIGSGTPIAARTSATPQPFHFVVDSVGTYSRNASDTTTPVGSGGSSNGATVKNWYDFGAPPSMGVPQARKYARAIYDAFVSFCFTQTGMKTDMPLGAWRVQRPDQKTYNADTYNGTVSEGIGYAMILAAIFSNPALPPDLYDPKAQAYFDGLWTYYKYYRNIRGLMDWTIDLNGNRTDTGGATDGDLDVAYALVLKHRISGSAGTTNYSAAATTLIKAIRDYEFTPATHVNPNVMMNGDQWGVDAQDYMPDYFRSGHMRTFYEHTGDKRWLAIIDKNYPIARGYFDQLYTTGMVPDWCNRQSQPVGGQSYNWGYNAIRSPWGTEMEYLWFGDAGANQLSRKQASKLAAFGKNASSGNPSNLKAVYELNGNPTASYNNIAHAQAFAVASIADSANSQFASDCLQYMYDRRNTDRTYFGLGLAAISSVTVAGLLQTYLSNAAPAANTASLSGGDNGSSTDTGRLITKALLKGSDTGGSTDRGTLRVSAYLSGNDKGSSSDAGSLSTTGGPANALLSGRDIGSSTDNGSLRGSLAYIFGSESGESTDGGYLLAEAPVLQKPQVGQAAQELYDGLGPLTEGDEDLGWPLLRFCAGVTTSLQKDYDLVRTSDQGIGWSSLLDLDRAPLDALPWLGQFVGVDPLPGVLNEESQRLRISEASGFKRGSVGAIKGAVRATLTGRRQVQIYERFTSPYHLRVVVFASETPDPDFTLQQLLAAKPAGLSLEFTVAAGVSYDELKRTGITYDDLSDTYPTYDAMRTALPPN